MDSQMRLARGDYNPTLQASHSNPDIPNTEPTVAVRYIAYPKAMRQLSARLGATSEELAAWIWSGPEDGGLAAYLNANELDPPPRFFYVTGSDCHDYIAPLMACWFREGDIEQFEPSNRYITGAALIERWSKRPDVNAVAFIKAKIAESRLLDIHPIYGGTQGTFSEHRDWPSLESGLFQLTHVKQIEAEDFDGISKPDAAKPPDFGSSEWRKQTARTAANALHDQPGGSREKQRQIREIWATGKYSTRDICAEQECARLDISFSTARKSLRNTPTPSRC